METRAQERLDDKYRQERDKRLNPKGNAQYIAVGGEFAGFDADPNAAAPIERDASTDLVDVVIVGGGISGLLTAVELRRAGIDDFRIIEKGSDFGGVWYWNRYPGLACDCESLIYLPLLEEIGTVPSKRYVGGAEIRGHLAKIADAYGLHDRALLQTRVSEVQWLDAEDRWVVRTDLGDALRAKFLILGSGPLNRPKLPGIPGISDFTGRQFHSSRWDYGYTGGGPERPMVNLADKRVAIVGTGTSAIQIVPHVARDAEHVYVVQRTPSVVDSRDNAPIDPDALAGLPSGWQQQRMENFDGILAGVPQDTDLIGDRWTQIWGGRAEAMATGSLEGAMQYMAERDVAEMERIRDRVEELVEDPATAESLKPWFVRFCKRPAFSDEYLPTFNRPNVTLIDTDGRGLDRLTETGIVFDGEEYAVDCIVYATGFEFGVAATRSGAFEVHGPSGMTLSEHRAQGVRSLHGMYHSGFPNLFTIGGLHQAGLSINIPLVFGGQGRHAAHLIRTFLEQGVDAVEVRPDAEERWGTVIATKSQYVPEAMSICTPGAFTNENPLDGAEPSVFATAYGGGPVEYLDVLERWRSGPIEADLQLTTRERS